ncbi:MAG: hypothetical protein KDK72_06120 [Chlamydiia bacterium]|nr:hypothetical protein [Chlamydiia bacterium]
MNSQYNEPLAKLVGCGFLAISWLTKGGVRSKLMTVCENEQEERRKIAGKTPQIILQVAHTYKKYFYFKN